MMKILKVEYVLKGTKKDVEMAEKMILDVSRIETVVGLHIEAKDKLDWSYIRGLK